MNNHPSSKKSEAGSIPENIKGVLTRLGQSLGMVSVYGAQHPSVKKAVEELCGTLQQTLAGGIPLVLGTFEDKLTLSGNPVVAHDAPTRSLERRLIAMKISGLTLTRGITGEELLALLTALSSPAGTQAKEALSSNRALKHIGISEVRYVAVDEREAAGREAGGGTGRRPTPVPNEITDSAPTQKAPDVKVEQIFAFLKGSVSSDDTAPDGVREMLSDPQQLGKLILESAAVRQSAGSMVDGESMADVVVGCLRRTYSGLRKESEFQSVQGKASLSKAMMLLEKSVLDKLHQAMGEKHPEVDRRIMAAIREMEEERQIDLLTSHYLEQRQKTERAEARIVEQIRAQGPEKARQSLSSIDLPEKEWKRLLIKAGVDTAARQGTATGKGSGAGGGQGGLDMGALALVLDRLGDLMKIEQTSPGQVKTAVGVTRNALSTYSNKVEQRIQELENHVEMSPRTPSTIEDHATHLDRDALMREVSQLILTLMQPLTVVSLSIESALRHVQDDDAQKELLELASESAGRIQALSKRLINLTGYPVLN